MNKQPGGKGCLQGNYLLALHQGWQQETRYKEVPGSKAHTAEFPKKIPSPMPTAASLEHLAPPAARGAGLALVLSAASSKGTSNGQLSMKGTEPESVQQLQQVCLSAHTGFGWGRVSVLLSSQYSAVVWI